MFWPLLCFCCSESHLSPFQVLEIYLITTGLSTNVSFRPTHVFYFRCKEAGNIFWGEIHTYIGYHYIGGGTDSLELILGMGLLKT
jgi:hypothetical protein